MLKNYVLTHTKTLNITDISYTTFKDYSSSVWCANCQKIISYGPKSYCFTAMITDTFDIKELALLKESDHESIYSAKGKST